VRAGGRELGGRTRSAVILAVALLVCCPLTAKASTASVENTDGAWMLLVDATSSDEENVMSIVRAQNGVDYAIEDQAGIVPASPPADSQCTSIDTTHVNCTGGLVQAVRVTPGDGNDRFGIADAAYPPGPPPLGGRLLSVSGGAGTDTLAGGFGDDDLTGEAGDDHIDGAAGNDSIAGYDGHDVIQGGPGGDAISGDAGVDEVSGGAGDDELLGGEGNDALDGGDGDDDVAGDDGGDTIDGGAGNDRLDFSSERTGGADTLAGGPGDDQLNGGPAGEQQDSDHLKGGDGTDTADFSDRTASLKIDLDGRGDDGQSGEDDNVAADVENLFGGSDSDTLTGSGAANFLDGRNGDDRVSGGGGDDTLDGGANNPGDDTLTGGAGRDTLNGRAGDDELDGGDGDDAVSGAGGTDKLDGDDGNDSLEGGAGGDALDGGPGNDLVDGAEADLIGADGSDGLAGGAGADVLLGDDGNDELDGGAGPDRMNGGAGRDTVNYENRSSRVTVTLDGVANDGEANEGDNVLPNMEIVHGGTVGDDLSGDGDANGLDGGPGEDLLTGNAGGDLLDGGNAPDLIQARDGDRDRVNCGDDGDLAIVDRSDTVRDCKWIDRGGKRRLVVARSALVRATPNAFGLRLPDGHRFFDLSSAVKIPIASTVDPNDGVVQLATARNRAGARQEISVSQGVFSVRQDAAKRAVTELRLAGRLRACGRSARAPRAPTDAPLRRLYTRVDKSKRGRYRVRGRYSIGAAVGTAWLTADRCDGTYTHVDSGVVRVRDRRRHTTVTVRAGESYLARAP
jgi:Ca2+-binding RTX toxin-like protein